jgi:hypothetical protein
MVHVGSTKGYRTDGRWSEIERSWLSGRKGSVLPPSRAELATALRVLMRSRPVDFSYRCIHCGQLHRIGTDQLGLVLTSACGRGQISISMEIPEA